MDGILDHMAARIGRGATTADWVTSIGPAACPCGYEVKEALVANSNQQLPLPAALITPRYLHLDLVAIAECKLRSLGLTAIERAGSVTVCTPYIDPQRPRCCTYTSYRHNRLRRA